MKKIKNKIRLFWLNSENKDFLIENSEEHIFNLTYGNLLVGTLSFYERVWHYAYSLDFQQQKEVAPIINFPNTEKEYKSEQLWPFFASRIPSNAQRDMLIGSEDLIPLLKRYGRTVISNPFTLLPV